nr:hypothetical protein [Tanacetum cinerariifolium]
AAGKQVVFAVIKEERQKWESTRVAKRGGPADILRRSPRLPLSPA